VIICTALLAGCSKAPIPEIPRELMRSPPEPVRAIVTQRDVALYALALATWGRGMAEQLDAICRIATGGSDECDP
jgi:hypothetical protein